tara:strand:+ start:605 stop:976 length:372 start_codon:yes stop_codon:yes gene_type:complete
MAHTVEDALIWWGRPEQWFGWSDLENKTYANIVLESKVLKDGAWINNPYKMPTEKEVNDKIAEMDLNELRQVRNAKLSETDYMGNSDVTMSDAWKTYRQELRDITKTFKSMDDKDFIFPTKPS